MIGSYGPSDQWLTKRFESDEAPSGMLARTGTCEHAFLLRSQRPNRVLAMPADVAKSRVTDDDGHVWADFECASPLAAASPLNKVADSLYRCQGHLCCERSGTSEQSDGREKSKAKALAAFGKVC